VLLLRLVKRAALLLKQLLHSTPAGLLPSKLSAMLGLFT
jgi:hypothetical protein